MEDEESPVCLEVVLRPSAFLLQSLDLVLLVFDEFAVLLDIPVVVMDGIVVGVDFINVVVDAVFKVIDPVVKVDDSFPEGFESNEELSFGIDSCLVPVLIPDLFPLVELVDLIFEIPIRNIYVLFVWLRIVCVSFIRIIDRSRDMMYWVLVVIRWMEITL